MIHELLTVLRNFIAAGPFLSRISDSVLLKQNSHLELLTQKLA